MAEAIDDNKFSKGTELYAVYNRVNLAKPALDLQHMSLDSLDADGFGNLGMLPYQIAGEDEITIVTLLQESHRLLIYNERTKELKDILYTCSPTKTGHKTFEAFKKLIGKNSSHPQQEYPAIVNKQMSLLEEKGFASVEEGLNSLGLDPEQEHYLACVFFDIPKRKIGEDSLESILTKTLNASSPKPVTEHTHRFEPEGFSYNHVSREQFSGMHVFNGLRSAHESIFGKGKDIAPILIRLGKELKSEYVTLRKVF